MTTPRIRTLVPLAAALAGALGVAPPAQADPLPYGPTTCLAGFVWREARDGDTVCVTPDVRGRTLAENANPSANKEPNGGAYGPNTCLSGFVWREAFGGDTICVTPAERSQTLADNAAAPSRVATQSPPTSLPPAPAEPATVTFEIYASRPGVQVDEIDIDTLGQKFGKTQLPFARTVPLPSPVTSLRLRAYGYGQDKIGCRMTVNGVQVMDNMISPVAICSWKA